MIAAMDEPEADEGVDERSPTVSADVTTSRRTGETGSLPERLTLIERIGSGGMGEVWRARDELLGRDVAVKVLRSGRTSTKLATRLEREARAIARLDHPAIVTIHDIGRDGEGNPYLVMELLQGSDLGDLLAGVGRIPAASAVQTMLPILEALDLAHRNQVIHRDLKPENVFIAEDARGRRRPKLLDFGIAGIGAGSGLTAEIIGTPEYMAPEQLRVQNRVGPAADQWAAAMTIYALVEGRPPFGSEGDAGPDLGAIFARIRSAPLPFPRSGSMDGGLFRVLARAARKEPEERFESMQAFADALREWLREVDEPERPSELPRPRGPQMTTRPALGAVQEQSRESGVSRKGDAPSLDEAIRQSLLGGER